jgi:GAF domain-containing protein
MKSLQTLVESVGTIFEVNFCVLRPFHDGKLTDELFVYQRKKDKSKAYRNGTGVKNRKQPERSSPNQSSNVSASNNPTIDDSTDQIDRSLPESLLAETIWETMDIEVINDIDTDENWQVMTPDIQQRKQTYQTLGIHSSLVVPLIFRMDLLAVMALHQTVTPRTWQDDEVQLGFMVADQASLSLSQVRAYEQVQALAKREALINTITSAIRSSLNPKDIFAAITQQLGEALQVDGCALSLWTEHDEYVQCVGLYEKGRSSVVRNEALQPTDSPLKQLDSPIGDGSLPRSLPRSLVPISGNPVHQQILATQEPVVIRDLEQVPELNLLDIPAGMDPGHDQLLAPSRALLVVPLISDGHIIGSISLRHNYTPVVGWLQKLI